jgi:hypothetical protein
MIGKRLLPIRFIDRFAWRKVRGNGVRHTRSTGSGNRQDHPQQVERNRRQQRWRDEKRRLVNLANNTLATCKALSFQSPDSSGPASSTSCKQHPSSVTCRWPINPCMLSEFFKSRKRIQALRDGPDGPCWKVLLAISIGCRLRHEYHSRTSPSGRTLHLLDPPARHIAEPSQTSKLCRDLTRT